NGMLGIRYYIEHKEIDILRWTVFKNSEPGVPAKGIMTLAPGSVVRRHIRLDARPFYAVGIPVSIRDTSSKTPSLVVTLFRTGEVVFHRAFTPADISALNKVYVPIAGDADIEVRVVGMRVDLLRGADEPLYYERIKGPLIFDRELPDGRIFRNAGEVPRFHAVRRLSQMTHDEFLAKTAQTDFRDEAVLTQWSGAVPRGLGGEDGRSSPTAQVTLRSYSAAEQTIDVSAPAGTFLASSEKLTPELRVTIDGDRVQPVEINMLFAGVPVPAGKHVVVFSRRLARGWWPVAAIALVCAIAWSLMDARRRRSPDTRTVRATTA
ncbi:MAG TPA: hypothetical protein VLU46_15805, partial [Thermoanaerobaculia bacterium]|nr:hypothetical protein [Thermoanaerobaculia bacterium]